AAHVEFPIPHLLEGGRRSRKLAHAVAVIKRLDWFTGGIEVAPSGFLLENLVESVAVGFGAEKLLHFADAGVRSLDLHHDDGDLVVSLNSDGQCPSVVGNQAGRIPTI